MNLDKIGMKLTSLVLQVTTLLSFLVPFIITEYHACDRLKYRQSNENLGIEVLWINMERSVDRKEMMLEAFHYYGLEKLQRRASAISMQQVISPEVLWPAYNCVKLRDKDLKIELNKAKDYLRYNDSALNPLVLNLALCGRRKNSMRELTVTISHLYTIYRAIHNIVPDGGSLQKGNSNDPKSKYSKYALILEDDLFPLVEIDFDSLIKSAPPDFAMLQLITSNDYSVMNLWRVFRRHKVSIALKMPN